MKRDLIYLVDDHDANGLGLRLLHRETSTVVDSQKFLNIHGIDKCFK
jgi:hypothetical protein